MYEFRYALPCPFKIVSGLLVEFVRASVPVHRPLADKLSDLLKSYTIPHGLMYLRGKRGPNRMRLRRV
jgi:hypothetical protein